MFGVPGPGGQATKAENDRFGGPGTSYFLHLLTAGLSKTPTGRTTAAPSFVTGPTVQWLGRWKGCCRCDCTLAAAPWRGSMEPTSWIASGPRAAWDGSTRAAGRRRHKQIPQGARHGSEKPKEEPEKGPTSPKKGVKKPRKRPQAAEIRPQEAQKRRREAPRRPQEAPRKPQEAPSNPVDGLGPAGTPILAKNHRFL